MIDWDSGNLASDLSSAFNEPGPGLSLINDDVGLGWPEEVIQDGTRTRVSLPWLLPCSSPPNRSPDRRIQA